MATRSVTARKRPADEALDLVGAARLLPLGRLAPDPLGRGPRQQRVLGGDPTLAPAPQPRRHPVLDRRRAQHLGLAHRHQDRAVGELGEVAHERHGSQVGDVTAVGAPGPGVGHSEYPRPTRGLLDATPEGLGGLGQDLDRASTVGHRWVTTRRRAPARRAFEPASVPLMWTGGPLWSEV